MVSGVTTPCVPMSMQVSLLLYKFWEISDTYGYYLLVCILLSFEFLRLKLFCSNGTGQPSVSYNARTCCPYLRDLSSDRWFSRVIHDVERLVVGWSKSHYKIKNVRGFWHQEPLRFFLSLPFVSSRFKIKNVRGFWHWYQEPLRFILWVSPLCLNETELK